MTKVKVAEATPMQLNYLVAVAEGYGPDVYMRNIDVRRDVTGKASLILIPISREYVRWEPATDWSQGGPIIEREHISVSIGDWDREIEPVVASWAARNLQDEMEGNSAWSYGPAPLIAAMRCYVASKLGDVVDVPEELV